ncbi:unnamed protein product [Trichogramma brassicae]|uniref:Protein krueppel n=1 Tax=Trichogramma brassicae TaxID=86971 RepID=A0A6H5IPQ2_9HYME|nr:unnamed protein product [Trichogramma brassicae]
MDEYEERLNQLYDELFNQAFRSEDEMRAQLEFQKCINKPKIALDYHFKWDFPIKQEPNEIQKYINNPKRALNNLECDFPIKREANEQENKENKEEINNDFDYHDRYGNKDSSPLSEYDEENQETSELTESVENQEASELIESVENQETSELPEYDKNQETELNGEDPTEPTRNSASDGSRLMDPTDGENEDRPIPATCANSNNNSSNNNSSEAAGIPLWQFFHKLLGNHDLYGNCIRWVDQSKAVFKIEDRNRLARLWGLLKKCPNMDYDKLSSVMDRYCKKKIIRKAMGHKMPVFQFSNRYLHIKDENRLANSWVDSDESHNQLTSEFECEDVKIALAGDSQPLQRSSEFPFETVFVECVPEDDLLEEASSNTDPISTGSAAKKSNNKYTCQACLKSFKSKHSLASHVDAVHLGVKAYECDLCHKSFGWRGDVKKHIDAIHRGLRPHQCPQCPRSFGQKQTLKLHHDAVHRQLRPYKCDQCDRTFGQKKTLVAHRDARHRGFRPYACAECQRSFARKDHLRMHMRSKHAAKNSEKE